MWHNKKVMLDDLQYITGLDKSNALGVVGGQPDQLRQEFNLEFKVKDINNMVLVGMGGSALPGEILRSWLSDKLLVPFVIVRDYNLPKFVGPKSLVIISSYSGNTEETLASLAEAINRQAQIVTLSSGGELAKIAAAKTLPHIKIPEGIQPRMAVFYTLKALVVLLQEEVGSGIIKELGEATDWLEQQLSQWMPDTKTDENEAKKIATTLIDNPVVVYAGPTLASAALKWKINLNENAKQLAFYYLWPEFSHNEFNSWLHPRTKKFKVIELQSDLDDPQIAKRFDISNRLLSNNMPAPLIVTAKGDTKLKQLLYTLLLGDYVSLYLAFLNGIDPTPVGLVERLKKEL